jgi:hypothetical protein
VWRKRKEKDDDNDDYGDYDDGDYNHNPYTTWTPVETIDVRAYLFGILLISCENLRK